MALDPKFISNRITVIVDRVIDPDPFSGAAEKTNSLEWIRADIEGLEEDAHNLELYAADARKQIPELERRAITWERDAALIGLRILQLKAKLAAKTGDAK
jgi:hypothetical protein